MSRRIAWMLIACLFVVSGVEAAEITSIDFRNENGQSILQVAGDSSLSIIKSENEADNQIVLDITGATLAPSVSRPLDTSSFEGPVKLVSPYATPDGSGVRIVVQLREAASSELKVGPNGATLVLGEGQESANGSFASEFDRLDAADAPRAASAPDSSQQPDIDSFLSARERQAFTGSPISLNVRGASVHSVLQLISETSGFNIVVSDDVRGDLTLSLTDVPWDQALDVVLNSTGLGAARNGNVLRVMTNERMTREEEERARAKAAAEANAPRITRVFPISYAEPSALVQALETMRSGTGGASGSGQEGGSGGERSTFIHVDQNTRSLLVRDTQENIDLFAKVIQMLDVQTPQIMIEGKIVEASEAFSKSIGGNIGFGRAGDSGAAGGPGTQFFSSFNGGNPTDLLLGGVFSDGAAVASDSANAGLFGISPTIAFLPGLERINAVVSMGESENLAKVVASPRVVVVNNESATISQAAIFPVTSTVVEGGRPVTTTTTASATLALSVTPQVTNDGNVVMSLSLSRPVIQVVDGVAGPAGRSIGTRVIVRDGSTLVLGGIYTMDATKSESGFPILRDIPILGALFGSESESTSRNELFMFITPRILNPQAAGLSASI